MSSIRLLILGVLLRKQPTHGYEVRRELEQWHADKWATIAYGSIYSALGKMAEEGLVEAVSSEPCERSMSRTEYVITARGQAEFERLLQEYWWELKPTIDPFQIALTFMDKLPRAQLLKALRHRADLLRSSRIDLSHLQPEQKNGRESSRPRHIAEGARLMLAHIDVELCWIDELCDKIERGEFP